MGPEDVRQPRVHRAAAGHEAAAQRDGHGGDGPGPVRIARRVVHNRRPGPTMGRMSDTTQATDTATEPHPATREAAAETPARAQPVPPEELALRVEALLMS